MRRYRIRSKLLLVKLVSLGKLGSPYNEFGTKQCVKLVSLNPLNRVPKPRNEFGTKQAWLTFLPIALSMKTANSGERTLGRCLTQHWRLYGLLVDKFLITACYTWLLGYVLFREVTMHGYACLARLV